MDLKICPGCGASNSPLARICYACGKDLPLAEEQPQRSVGAVPPSADCQPTEYGDQPETPPGQTGQLPPQNIPPYPQTPPYVQQMPQSPPYGQPNSQSDSPFYPLGYRRKSRTAAAVLGILLGVIGVHNFYLGYTGKAVAQLLISLLSGFILSVIPFVWGIVEGIMLLCGTINTDGRNVPLAD